MNPLTPTPFPTSSLARLRRKVRRAVLGRRRLLAAGFAAVAVLSGLRVVAGPPPATTVVLTAVRDLPSGTVLDRDDVRETAFLPQSVPAGVLDVDELLGRTTAGPLRAGEALTDAALVQGSILEGYPGLVATGVRIGDAETVDLLRVGDRIDLVAADGQGWDARMLARDVPVLALPRVDSKENFSGDLQAGGRLLIVAIPEESVGEIAQAGVSSYLSVVIRR